MTFRIYFYKGTRPGVPGIYNRLVRARGRGKYSHVELCFSDGMSASSSFEDKGTRFKWIEYNDKNWDYIDLPPEWEQYARDWFVSAASNNNGYDLWGNVHIAVGFVPDSFKRYFCSEAAAKALKIEGAFRFEPNALYDAVRRAAEAYQEGQQSFLKAA